MGDYATDEEADLLDFADAQGACAEVVDLRSPIDPVCALFPSLLPIPALHAVAPGMGNLGSVNIGIILRND